ncbi:hypothetical protein [Paraburkholderia acidiphila]|uniref:Uncharacterized protein n=1 Tax=Paraburkholderia acidiphila TaxID=2571747 RepID=A0A7Z2G8C3_9BURK|nr:hypothetical protein [Paraburkholderia acidiphila]QGZ57073.1 hypothetical protein FAZ97_19235 [Paraburkholderia acidiphila]
MNTENDEYTLRCCEAIRKAAFALASGGVFEGWAAVERTLCLRFSAEQVHQVFASPFFRLDLVRRCHEAQRTVPYRTVGPAAVGQECLRDQPAPRKPTRATDRRPKDDHRRYGGRPPKIDDRRSGVAREIAALMSDRVERTAAQLAQCLGAVPREVQRALRTMLANDEVHIVGRVRRSEGGRCPRLFAGGPRFEYGVAAANAPSFWPKVDPQILRIMDALVRHK